MTDTIARMALIGAVEKALFESGIKGEAADELRRVGATAERIAWGTFRTTDANGVEYKCPLGQTDLCKPVYTEASAVRLDNNLARDFYRAFDSLMSQGGYDYVALEVTD